MPRNADSHVPVLDRESAAPVALLGTNLWAVAIAVPAALAAEDRLLEVPVVLPLVTLALGLVFFARRAIARILLLVAFPVSLAPGLDFGHGAQAWVGAAVATLTALSFIAYLAAASWALEGAAALISTTETPFAGGAPIGRPGPRGARRAWVFALGILGALAMAIVAPHLDPGDSWAAAFGESAGAASTLTSVIGGLLGTLVIGGYLAPATRATRRRARRSGARAAIYGAVAFAGLVLLALS